MMYNRNYRQIFKRRVSNKWAESTTSVKEQIQKYVVAPYKQISLDFVTKKRVVYTLIQ